jgi:competence ComEA-like helix-hairpin-helix protein
MKASLRKRLYALQQRLAITSTEATACLGFALLIGFGGIVQHCGGSEPAATAAHLAMDEVFAEGASRAVEDLFPEVTQDSVRQPGPETRTRAAPTLGPIRMDPNTASAAMLQRLPGIGPALAGRIVEHREAHGPFRRPRDVTRVSGIGPRTFERLEPYLYIAEQPAVAERQPVQAAPAGGAGSSDSLSAPSPR